MFKLAALGLEMRDMIGGGNVRQRVIIYGVLLTRRYEQDIGDNQLFRLHPYTTLVPICMAIRISVHNIS